MRKVRREQDGSRSKKGKETGVEWACIDEEDEGDGDEEEEEEAGKGERQGGEE